MVRGSCLCRAVTWEVNGPFELMTHCHCSMCRKAHGGSFATFVGTQSGSFRWLGGEDRVVRYQSSPGSVRPFCSDCGSVVPLTGLEGRVFMPSGNLDDDPGVRPIAHIFVASKAPWYEISDELPRFEAYPPGWESQPLEREPPPQSGDGLVRGSCLCGGVAWEVAGEPTRFAHCHCSRCRKARSAAHASNLFFSPETFHWHRGEELLRRYKVPEARVFTNVFCSVCGSIQPRVGEAYAVVPMGAVDGDPRPGTPVHIFVGSKAPWFEITDSAPQFEGSPQR